MAFWDNWFKFDCQNCHQGFKKQELVPYEDLKVCPECKDKLIAAAEQKARETEERRLAEEKARAALLDRPIDTSGKPFGAGPSSGSGNSRF